MGEVAALEVLLSLLTQHWWSVMEFLGLGFAVCQLIKQEGFIENSHGLISPRENLNDNRGLTLTSDQT